MSVQKIVDYVMHTPHNTNPAILKQVINDNISWNDLKDKPFYSEVETHVIFDNVTTTGEYLSSASMCDYSPDYDDTFTFVIDGVTYDEVAPWYMDEDAEWHFDVDVEGEDVYCGATYRVGGTEGRRWFLICPNGHTVSFIITRKVVHQVLPMFLPNSVWGEEETLTILDNVKLEHDGSASSGVATFHADFNMKVGDILTLVIDGVKYTEFPEFIQYGSNGHTSIYAEYNGCKTWHTENYPDEENNWRIEHYGGTVSLFITRTKVKTNCDLMIGADADGNPQLVRGNYSNALTKALSGLPVSAYLSAVGLFGATNSVCQVMVSTDEYGNFILDVFDIASGRELTIDYNNNVSFV